MKVSQRICRATVLSVALIMSFFGVFCVCDKFGNMFRSQGVQVMAAGLAMHNSVVPAQELNNDTSQVKATIQTLGTRRDKTETDPTAAESTDSDNLDTDYAVKDRSTDTDHSLEESYLVTECLYRESNMSYDNFFVKNSTDLSIDLGSYLNADLPFVYEETTEPQVLIVHTHATESYMDEDVGYYYESFYPRDTDDNYNMISIGNAIAKKLEQNGIGVAHCCEHHDDPQYYGAYDNCADSIREYMEKYPSIKIVLDIHRDSITTDEGEKIKPTFVYNGKKAAQIMIMCGNDNYGYYDFPDWEQNMSLAVKLQSVAETKYPGMTRPLYFGNFMYNMNLAPGSLLIEVGTDANTHDEAVYSGELLGDVVATVLKSIRKSS